MYRALLIVRVNDTPSLNQLKKIVENSTDEQTKVDALTWLCWAFEQRREFGEATAYLESLLDDEDPPKTRWHVLRRLAHFHRQAGQLDEGVALLLRNLQTETDSEYRSAAFQQIAEIESDRGHEAISAIAYEKAVENAPGDTSLLFKAAYSVSDVDDFEDLAINNYDALLAMTPQNAMAVNNLAVLAGDFPETRVGFYKRSIALGETLAMANLANIYIDNGFFDQADELLQNALGNDDVHESVNGAIVRLREEREKEQKEWGERQERSRRRSMRIRAYGDFLFRQDYSAAFEGTWVGAQGMQIIVTVEGTHLHAHGEREFQTGGGLVERTMKGKDSLTITGEVRGHAAKVVYHRVIEPTTILSFNEKGKDCYSYVDDSGMEWRFFPVDEDDDFELTLTRSE